MRTILPMKCATSKSKTPPRKSFAPGRRKAACRCAAFFNTSGLLYKGFGLKEKLPSMPEAEQFALLAQHGMLVKRPLVVADDAVLVGFREAEWSAALL